MRKAQEKIEQEKKKKLEQENMEREREVEQKVLAQSLIEAQVKCDICGIPCIQDELKDHMFAH